MSRYRGHRRGVPPLMLLIALVVAIAAMVLIVINLGKDKKPANDDADTPPITSGNDAQPGNTDDPNTADGNNTSDDAAPTYQKIELKGEEQQYDAVYRVGDAGYEMYTYVDSTAKKYADNVNAVADTLAGKATVYMLPVPLSSGISLPDELYGKDIFADQKDAEQKIIGYMNGNVKSVALYDALMAHRTEYVYFRTDHHWTTQGALTAYQAWCAATGHTPQDWQLETASTTFRGTLYSKVLLPDSPYDTVAIASDAAVRSMDCDGEVSDSLYSLAALEEKDHYKIFMGGNYAKVIIDTGANTGKSLLVVKDSFANSFLPFLVRDYDTITVLDLRFYREGVQPLADQADDVLVLYELTNFASDKNLYKLNKT